MDPSLAVATALRAVASIPCGELPHGVAGLVALVGDVQALRNRLDGLVNDVFVALARVEDAAMREEFPGEEFGADFIGRVAQHSQAPELVAPCLGVSVRVAENRVVTALELAERAPELVAEMRSGRLDAFRAGLIHQELSDAPGHIEDLIIERLIARADRAGGWRESAGPVLRRTRSVLATLAPEVLAARVAAARDQRGLHKRGQSECLDRWDGLYHVEDSRMAWAAIDDLAHELVKSGQADNVAQARADAHMALLLGHCDATVHLHATTPAGQAAELSVVQAAAATVHLHATTPAGQAAELRVVQAAAAPVPAPDSGQDSYRTGPDAVRERTEGSGPPTKGSGHPTKAEPVIEVGGFGGPGFVHVRRRWLADALASGRAVIDEPVTCHPDSGAILDGAIAKGFTRASTRRVTGDQTDPRYRIPESMARLVRFRDRQCRFPGCAISSRFCDLDHVIAWPDGPTSPANLMALCRRHHRLKQSPGWSVAIHPDLTVTWTDPVGRTHTSYPSDHLGILEDAQLTVDDPASISVAAVTAYGPLSPLEDRLTRLFAA
ncbi:MAG: DUF222 domain-containing protein [Dermatophilaceae bacterium]